MNSGQLFEIFIQIFNYFFSIHEIKMNHSSMSKAFFAIENVPLINQ